MTALRPRCAMFALASWLLIAAGSALAGPETDGPYLYQRTDEQWIARWVTHDDEDARTREARIAIGQSVFVDRVRQVPAFDVPVRIPATPAPDQIALADDAPLMVVADTHGEYEILVELLRKHGVVGDRLQWTFGNGHLAFLGDIFDRGAHQTEILWLIYKLEAEATSAGGAVHLVLGNHEAMVLRGDVRYLNPKYLRTAEVLGVASYSDLFAPDSLLGQWLRSKPAVVKIDDLLLVHGGVSPNVVAGGYSLSTINETLRTALNETAGPDGDLAALMLGKAGPLWYRGYFPTKGMPAEATMGDVDAVLAHFDAKMILVGHTAVPTITQLYQGKVIAVQVYPHVDASDGSMIAEAALRRGGRWYRAHANGEIEEIPPPL